MLENLPIATKLRLSFGFMLLLSLLITYTGWTTLDYQIDNGDKLSTIQTLNKIISDAKSAREDYIDTHDETYRVKLAEIIESMINLVASAQVQYTSADDAVKLKKIMTYASDYKNIFNRITPLVQTETKSSAIAFELGEKLIKQLEQQINSQRKTAFEANEWQTIADITHINLEQEKVQSQLYNMIETGALSAQAYSDILDRLNHIQKLNLIDASSQTVLDNIKRQLHQYMETQQALETIVQEYITTAINLNSAINTMETDLLDQKQYTDKQARFILLIVSGIVILIGIVTPLIITSAIAKPLRETVQAAERIANGDLTNPMNTTRQDEVGALQNAIGSMTRALKELIDNVNEGIADISTGASQLSAVSEQNRIAMTQQRIETEQVATAMNQMAATVQEVASNAEQTSEATGEAEQLTNEGYNNIKIAIAAIQELNIDIEQTSQAMQVLAQQTHGISKVMDVIKSVAEQTNLLALNAAIEAARAGESGRGFAVVADEVRSLAKRTQESTDEIESMIQQLQSGAKISLQMMEHSQVVASTNVTNAAEVGNLFEKIAKAVSSVQLMNHQIAAASEEQSTVAEEINRSISHVNEISNQTAAASEETAAATKKLVTLGNHLQMAISKFRIN